jgi:hypothetical protein
MVTTTLDEVLSACQQAHAVNGKLFNTVVAAMKIGMWLEVPLQRASVIARAYSFRTTGDETAGKKAESDRASAISKLTRLHTGQARLVAQYHREPPGLKVLQKKCVLTNTPLVSVPFFEFSPQLARATAAFEELANHCVSLSPEKLALRTSGTVTMRYCLALPPPPPHPLPPTPPPTLPPHTHNTRPVLETAQGVLAQSPTVNNICNKWVQGAAHTSDGAATAFNHLRKGGRAAMRTDNCRVLALEDKHTDDLAIAMDHTRKTAETDYSPASSTVTADQETVYKKLQNRFIQAACIETALPKFQGHLAGVLESLAAIAGGIIPPSPQSSASSTYSTYSSSMSSTALAIAIASKSGLHPRPLPPPSMRLPTEPPAIILSLLPSPSSKSSSSTSSVSSTGPPPITLSLLPLAGDCDALELDHEPTRVDSVPTAKLKPLAATAALAPIILSLLPAAGACDPLEPTPAEAVPTTTKPLAVAVASQSATTARHNAIATLLVEKQMSSHELAPPPPAVIQRAIMILVTGKVLSFGGIGSGNELEDAANLCARQALQSELETDAIACGRPRPHERAAHLMSLGTPDRESAAVPAVPRREHEALGTMSSCDTDIGAQSVLAEGAPPAAAAEAIPVIRAPCLDPPAGTLFAMRPRSRRGPPVRAVATHLAGLARARPPTASSTHTNSVAGEWRLRLCWLGRQTPTLVSLEAICCVSNDGQLPQLALQWMDDAVALASRNDPTVVAWWADERARRSNTPAPPRPIANLLVEDVEEHTDGAEKSSSEDTENEEAEDRADGNINGEINGVEEVESFEGPPIGIFQPNLSWSRLVERSQHLQSSPNTCSAATSITPAFSVEESLAMDVTTSTMSSHYERRLHSCVVRAAAAADAYGGQKRKAPSTPSNEPKSQSSGAKKIKAGEEPLYEVEALLGKETRRGGGNRYPEWFLVKWKGYPRTENTWEPKENLPHQMVAAFEAWLDQDA